MKQKIIDEEIDWFSEDSEENEIDFIQSNFSSQNEIQKYYSRKFNEFAIRVVFEDNLLVKMMTRKYEVNGRTKRLHPESKTDVMD